MIKTKYLLFSVALILSGCTPVATVTPHKINFIVLLDLSDRLLTQNQPETDIAIVKSIFSTFKDSVRLNRFYIQSNDHFKVRIAPQKNSPLDVRNYENQLSLSMGNLAINQKKKAVEELEEAIDVILNNLYKEAHLGDRPNDYFGADIWKYFNEELDTDLIHDGSTTNYLFILTDGYLYFENFNNTLHVNNRFSSCSFMKELRGDDWETKFEEKDYGIIPVNKKIENLNVMLLEVNPREEFLNEYDLLNKIWIKWLGEMNIHSTKICKKASLSKVNEEITQFIKNSK